MGLETASNRALISFLRRADLDSRDRLTERHGAMRKLIYGMNLTLDGYIAAPGDDLGWSGPSDELFQWWLDQELAIGLLMYGRKLWEAMSSHWPTGDQQPDATPAQIEFARNWRDTPKVVFSSTIDKVDWNTRYRRPFDTSPAHQVFCLPRPTSRCASSAREQNGSRPRLPHSRPGGTPETSSSCRA